MAARRSLSLDAIQGRFPATAPGLALGLDLASALWGQARDDHTAVGLRADPFDVAGLGQVVEHRRHGRRAEPGRGGQVSRRELAALVELDQQLELSVTEL